MHVVFVEPRFPSNQRFFVKALKEVGATVTAIGEGSKDSLSGADAVGDAGDGRRRA